MEDGGYDVAGPPDGGHKYRGVNLLFLIMLRKIM